MADVSGIYSSAYRNVENFPVIPKVAKITDAGVDDDPFNKTPGSQLIWVTVNDEDVRIRINRTNAKGLIDAFGSETEDWIGKQISICRIQERVKNKLEWVGKIKPHASKVVKGQK